MSPAVIAVLIRAAIAFAAVTALLWGYRLWAESLRETGRAEVRAEHAEAARAAETRNRELQRAAETRYVVQAATRDRFFVETIREVSHAAAPLAACPVPDDARRLLNAAATCASGDSPAACGGAGPVRPAAATP